MRMSAALTSSYSPIAPARPPSRIMSAFPSEPAKESVRVFLADLLDGPVTILAMFGY